MSMTLPTLKWVASPNFSARGAAVDLIVLHDCEGSYAGAVSWFAQEKSQVSAHLVLKEDGTEATQMVSFADKAWHACDFNSRSIGIEMGGMAARGFPDAEWQTAANVVAYLLRAYGLPCQWAKGGQGTGFTSHFDLGQAGGGHKDPTTDPAVWAAFVARVEAAYAAGGFLSTPWGKGIPVKAAPPPAPIMKIVPKPMLSISTIEAQRALNKAGAMPRIAEDGAMGNQTRSAIAAFQGSHGLYVDGLLNAATVAALVAL